MPITVANGSKKLRIVTLFDTISVSEYNICFSLIKPLLIKMLISNFTHFSQICLYSGEPYDILALTELSIKEDD